MASTITPTMVQFVGNNNLGDTGIDGWQVTWGPMASGDTPVAVSFPGYADKTIQAVGTLGTGVGVEGSNDLVNFGPLSAANGTNPLTISTTKGVLQVLEHCIMYRPTLPASGASGVTATMFFRKTQAQSR